MGKMLSALLHLQTIERQLVDVRNRLRVRQNAVSSQQRKIDQIRDDWEALNEHRFDKRKEADGFELDLKEKEQKVASLRGVLNTAKTNKEYAAVLTEINTLKADNSKLEDDALNAIQEVDAIKAQADQKQEQISQEEKRLEGITASSSQEIERLEAMVADLTGKRADATKLVPAGELALFERIASRLSGDAMAPVEVHGAKPPYDYICGGCYMALNAEHANALGSKDEIRICDSCGRILYLEAKPQVQ